jgi:hypothetical protein
MNIEIPSTNAYALLNFKYLVLLGFGSTRIELGASCLLGRYPTT